MKNEQEIVRSVFDAYIRDAKATSTKKDRPTFDMLEEVKNRAIKALEQQPSDDVMAIHTQGLAEGIRCAMCTNSMKSDKGCDGGCVVDNKMYKKVMETIKNQMFSQPTSDDCVSRQAVILKEIKRILDAPSYKENGVTYSYCYDSDTKLKHIRGVI